MTNAEEIYNRFVQYERNDVSDLLKLSIIQAINEAMGINVKTPCNPKNNIMTKIKYTWHSLASNNCLQDLNLSPKNEDDNFFKSREEAIKWLEKMKKADDLFADGDCLILTEMFFT